MKFVIFGLTVSSSWGNGHATLWRGLIRALSREGHKVVFFEHDMSWYADSRDLHAFADDSRLVLYPDWDAVAGLAQAETATADIAIVPSYCPDAVSATNLILASAPGLTVFYDLDTPLTLARHRSEERRLGTKFCQSV